MIHLNAVLLKLVRWSGWPLFAVVVGFVITGYAASGRYGFGRLLDAQEAMTWHKLLHAPLLALLLVHSLPAMYLAVKRWGWLRKTGQKTDRPDPTTAQPLDTGRHT